MLQYLSSRAPLSTMWGIGLTLIFSVLVFTLANGMLNLGAGNIPLIFWFIIATLLFNVFMSVVSVMAAAAFKLVGFGILVLIFFQLLVVLGVGGSQLRISGGGAIFLLTFPMLALGTFGFWRWNTTVEQSAIQAEGAEND